MKLNRVVRAAVKPRVNETAVHPYDMEEHWGWWVEIWIDGKNVAHSAAVSLARAKETVAELCDETKGKMKPGSRRAAVIREQKWKTVAVYLK